MQPARRSPFPQTPQRPPCRQVPARSAAGWLLLLALAALAGCQRGPARQVLEGTVTCDGQPLAAGYIIFRPESPSEGPAAAIDIVDGGFSIPAADGAWPGTCRVEITASRPSGKSSGPYQNVYAQFLPPRYNDKTGLRREVTAGGPNHYQFDLHSQ